jgi:hypothetical protein
MRIEDGRDVGIRRVLLRNTVTRWLNISDHGMRYCKGEKM